MNDEQIEAKKDAMQRAKANPVEFIVEQMDSLRYSYSEDEETYGAALEKAVELADELNTWHWQLSMRRGSAFNESNFDGID